MKYKILFPNEPYNRKEVDSSYKSEYNVSKTIGMVSYFYDYDVFVDDGKLISNIDFTDPCTIIYRGWMLKPEKYTELYNTILDKSSGFIKLINDPTEYRNCHCFPNVYDLIKKYTPRMVMVDNHNLVMQYKSILNNIEYDFFIKDHVKSAKTDKGVEKIDRNISCFDLMKKVNDFVNERGKLFTGGIVLKEFVNLKKIDGKTNEWRCFFLNGKMLNLIQNSNLETESFPSLELIYEVNRKLICSSKFFTVDFAQLEDDSWIVIETGDGQVSGLPNDSCSIPFYAKLSNSFNL